MNSKHRVALYLRLSREDNHAEESESIANQRSLLVQFVTAKNWDVAGEYVDDGYTGTNFQRPGFQKLIDDIESQKIDCVVVKDLSRLGRDYIETGYYLEKFFPDKHVRFIAVSDQIDTAEQDSTYDFTPFKAVINDMYARDISNKVRGALKAKMNAGLFIGAHAPYGYKKDSEDKNKLLIDPQAAIFVRRIFDLYLNQGLGYSKIAQILTNEGISTPLTYKRMHSNYRNPSKAGYGRWAPDTIRQILTNPTYAGNLAQGKERVVSYKINRKEVVPQEKWIVVNGTHESIVSQDMFDAVQKLIARNISHERKRAGTLTGLFFCGDCGTRMTYSTYYTAKHEERMEYLCTNYKRFRACNRHAIQAKEVEQFIDIQIRSMLENLTGKKSLAESILKMKKQNGVDKLDVEIKRLQQKLDALPGMVKRLYLDKLNAVISEWDYLKLKREFDQEEEMLKCKLDYYLKIKSSRIEYENTGFLTEEIGKIINSEPVDRKMIIKLIDRIEIFNDRTILIRLNFRSPAAV